MSPPAPPSSPPPTNQDENLDDSSTEYALTPVKKNVPVLVRKDRSKMYKDDGSFNENEFYSLLGNDIRRKILSKLAKFQRYASDLAIDLGVSKQAIKKHLDKLVEFGLVKQIESQDDQKKQYYQINPNIVLSARIDLTPNFYHVSVQNTPEDLAEEISKLDHDPRTAMISSTKARIDYGSLNHSLKYLGGELHKLEAQIAEVETKRKEILIQKTVMLNRIQMIINAIVEDDLEKDVIFSLFFDTHSTVEGLTLNDIINELFLRKRKRAGIPSDKYQKTDPKTIERGQKLLELLEMLIKNFGFIRSEDMRLYFDFEGDSR
ncbi:MAG: ArsR/SmtB family transcription factor [Promethearchaeota archaeon]